MIAWVVICHAFCKGPSSSINIIRHCHFHYFSHAGMVYGGFSEFSLPFIWIFGSPVRSTTLRLPKRASSSRRTLALTWLSLLQPLKSIIKTLDQSLKLLLKTLTTMTNCSLGNGVSHTKDWTWCVSAKKGMGTLVRVKVVVHTWCNLFSKVCVLITLFLDIETWW